MIYPTTTKVIPSWKKKKILPTIKMWLHRYLKLCLVQFLFPPSLGRKIRKDSVEGVQAWKETQKHRSPIESTGHAPLSKRDRMYNGNQKHFGNIPDGVWGSNPKYINISQVKYINIYFKYDKQRLQVDLCLFR